MLKEQNSYYSFPTLSMGKGKEYGSLDEVANLDIGFTVHQKIDIVL
jgi:hypothetical protein